MTVQKMIKQAEKVFNKFIRLRDVGKPCISCGAKYSPSFDPGHLYSAGGHWAVRFFETNVHGQCKECNGMKAGNFDAYYDNLKTRISEPEIMLLNSFAHRTANYTRDELQQIIDKYTNKIKEF